MKIYFTKTIFIFFLSTLFYSCANITSPTGGAKDVTAPKLKNRSVKDSLLNYTGGKIQFEFDEFIQLKDVQNQLVVTPLLKNKPLVTSHKKTVSIYLADSLLEKNTTYQISLGNAIQDIHEGNPAKNIRFTFSTGGYFDSLSLKGNVVDAFTGKTDTAAWVLLYPNSIKDSAIIKEVPLYVQKVSSGDFQFNNLPNRNFKIFALHDLNANFKYDAIGEKIGFLNDDVNPTDSTLKIKLYTFLEKSNTDTSSNKTTRGKIEKSAIATSLSYMVSVDTLNKTKRTFGINDTLKITLSSPIKKIDPTKIRLYQGDIIDESALVDLDSTKKIIRIKPDWTEDAAYKLTLQKGFAYDSLNNAPASEYVFKTKRLSDYGILTIKHKIEKNNFIAVLLNDKIVQRKKMLDSVSTFTLLNPGNYQINVLQDENGNGIWDTGSFFSTRIQPEITVLFSNEITIKANWENKIDLRMIDSKKPRLSQEKK